MRQVHKFSILIFLLSVSGFHSLQASKWEEEQQEKRIAQITFITPIGTNGGRSALIANSISLNLLMGVSGGVNGFEFGGFHNTTQGDSKGFQAAGFGNYVTGISKGMQFSGLYNIDMGLSTGVQIAGITNIIKGPAKGVHFAGITNVTSDESWAVQIGGIANVAPKGNHGVQFSGISNYNGEEGDGAMISGISNVNLSSSSSFQFSGISNVNTEHLRGVQIAGISNYTKSLKGLQFAGISNVTGKESSGSQIAGLVNVNYGNEAKFQGAGLVNVSTQATDGAQIAAIANYTKVLRGFQFALINVADTVEKGVPLGLISIVKQGYYAFEIEANDAFWINGTYKMGIPKLYNVFTAGFTIKDGKEVWGVGLGFGTLVSFGEKWGMNFDLTATHINEEEAWTEELNLLNRLKINASFDVGVLKIYGGPSLNVFVSNLENSEGVPGGSFIDPGLSFYNGIHGDTRTIIYPGFNLGIRF